MKHATLAFLISVIILQPSESKSEVNEGISGKVIFTGVITTPGIKIHPCEMPPKVLSQNDVLEYIDTIKFSENTINYIVSYK